MAIEYTPESNLVSDPAEGGSFSPSNDAELAGAQSFAAQAKLSETAAATSATNAATSETNAANSASAAATSATESATSATASATSATQSATSATASANSATAAATSETNAATSATNASNSATAAATSATNAATSETNAATSATAASNSATAAATSATNAATSETNAANSATAAATSATNAATSATAASNSATAASTSATAAATSETNAANSATAAATSATDAATSATAAANSATASATSATASAGSATNASNSATSAATAQTAAESARDAALAAFDSFDDRYLGQKSSDPSTDNDGNTLVAGTLYFNTTDDTMKVYEGSTWVAAYASLSGALIANNNLSDLNNAATARTNLGLGTIATAAATDYVPVTGGTFTGNVESPEFIGTLQGEVVFKAQAGEAISKGDAVYVSGISGNTPVVSKADANDSSKMPAFGLSADTVSANAAMEVVILGQLTHIDTSSFSLGDTLYISNTPGALSATKPSGESSQLQNIGKVERVHATTGSILVSGSGRSAATPNLNDGNFFLGDATNCSVSTDFTTAVLGEISAGSGISISASGVISNSSPDQTVSLTGAGATSISGTYPNFTITSTDNDTTYSVGDGGLTQNNFTDALKTKLDGIETGATADQTASEILTAIKTVDGTGSGLDADTVDGLQASQFLRSDASDSTSGSLQARNHDLPSIHGAGLRFWNGSDSYRIYMASSGTSGAGRVSGETTSDYNMYFRMTGGTNRGFVFQSGTSNKAGIDASGNARFTGNVIAYASDERLKENIKPIENPLEKLSKIRGVTYDWKDNIENFDPKCKTETGVIAQEIEAVIPDAISPAPFNAEYKTVEKDKIIALLIEAVKELKAEVDELKGAK